MTSSTSAAHAAETPLSTPELASAVAALLLLSPLQDFLVQYSRVLCDQFAPAVPDAQLRAFVNDVFDEGGQTAPADVVLEFKHVCRCVSQPAAAPVCCMWATCLLYVGTSSASLIGSIEQPSDQPTALQQDATGSRSSRVQA